MVIKVTWDFGDTDLEDISYTEALKQSSLPDTVTVPEQVLKEWKEEGDYIIIDWLSDEYGYTHFGFV